MPAMDMVVENDLGAVAPEAWNRLAGDNPFLRHEFLHALERSRCVGPGTGWESCYVLLRSRERLLGAVPLYRKDHSYGEYVFDWSWADAYTRSGGEYYPKLVAAVPFTPATGNRLLIAPDAAATKVAPVLIAATQECVERLGASSLHWLFPTAAELETLTAHGFLARVGCQFHWSNPGYRDFADYLGAMTAHKRKNIRRERRQVHEAGVTLTVLQGAALTAEHWNIFYRFYRSTVRAHGAIAYLTREFFHSLGAAMPERCVLTLARRGDEYVGAAFALRNAHTLYGRYWGGRSDIPGLHFETCYYTPIEYCIAEGIQRYEAGAQGEHKLARGFAPTPTYSAHWLRDRALHRAVADFLKREQQNVGYYIDELNEHLPFRAQAP